MNQNILCSRCKKNMAVVFITKMENNQTTSEGLCLKCAKEIGLKPVEDLMKKMGISEDELDSFNDQMLEGMDTDELFQKGGVAPFPFLQNLGNTPTEPEKEEKQAVEKPAPHLSGMGGQHAEEYRAPTLKFLGQFCENLNEKAKQGRMDNIIGRNEEIYRVIQILNRRTKNNPCLIGEPGVGKTAIAEGIAQRIVQGQVPEKLRDKVIYMLDLTGLIAGTQFRGQFEARVKGLIADVKRAGNAILFIDEVHSLVGTGESEGSMNAANILKPALSRGEIQVIGATTFAEYRKHIEKDAALERRFQPVKVGEPNLDDAVGIVTGVKRYYEAYHRVHVSDDMIRQIVTLSERYINDRFLPDKAIDLLDEACSCASLESKELEEFDRLVRLKLDKEAELKSLENGGDIVYEKTAELKADIARKQQRLDEIADKANNVTVTNEHVARVIELWTGIPASKIKESEAQKVAHLEDDLKKRIIGQDAAVETVAAAVRRSRIRLSQKKRPASFIFVGPTGVGKTELVKVLSETMFNNVEPLIRLDMSEYMEKFSVSRIIGSPPGYVGYDEAGQLTEKVRRRPYSIVLFDEIEKAHPDVLNILLQILDEGKISDAQGRSVSFENTIIVMTSNAGSERKEGIVGFDRESGEAAAEKARAALSDFLRPEFLARIDEIVVFQPLTKEDYAKIAILMLQEVKASLSERNCVFGWSDAVPQKIAELSHGKKTGAREIRHNIRRFVEDPICLTIAENPEKEMGLISAVIKDGEIAIETR